MISLKWLVTFEHCACMLQITRGSTAVRSTNEEKQLVQDSWEEMPLTDIWEEGPIQITCDEPAVCAPDDWDLPLSQAS